MLKKLCLFVTLFFSVSAFAAIPSLSTTGPSFLNLLEFFGMGLLLAFTPCVLPMVPILSGIIVGQKNLSTLRSFQLSLTFVLSMAFTYAIAGVAAGYLGHTIQGALQSPIIIISFSAIFVIMAFSMFGYFNLQMPGFLQNYIYKSSNKQKSGSLVGVAIMGILSTLIAAPCVTAPLVSVLTYISNTGNAVTGGLTLFVLALGMGVPLLLFGMGQGKLLPKSGDWMNVVKSLFGVMMLGLATWMISRILSTQISLILYAILFFGSAIGFGISALNSQGKSKLISQLISLFSIIASIFIAIQILPNKTNVPPMNKLFTVITTQDVLQKELLLAKNTGKPVMLDFYATWCTDCQALDKNFFAKPEIQKILSTMVAIRIDVSDEHSEEIRKIRDFYHVYGTPTILFIDKNGKEFAQRLNEGVSTNDLEKIRGQL